MMPTGAETIQLDAADPEQLRQAMAGRQSVLSALSFRFNPLVARAALETGLSYFDLTEDIATTQEVRRIAGQAAEGQIFMPQCGLAPGFISIVAHYLAKKFDRLDRVADAWADFWRRGASLNRARRKLECHSKNTAGSGNSPIRRSR